MAWLRIDDGFDSHPKILALGSDQRRWTWSRILVYTCRYRSATIPANITDSIPRATPQFLRECIEIGLVDSTDGGTLEVHDWDDYQAGGTTAERQRRSRDTSTNGGAEWRNIYRSSKWQRARETVFERDQGICTDCGKQEVKGWNCDHEPHAEDLINAGLDAFDPQYLYTRCHSCHAIKTRKEGVTRRDHNRDQPVTSPVIVVTEMSPHAGGRARPVPSRPHNPSPTPPPDEEEHTQKDQDRMQAWLDYAAQQPGITATLPYARKGYDTGAWPPQEQRTPDPSARCSYCGERLGYGHADDCPALGSASERALADHLENVHTDEPRAPLPADVQAMFARTSNQPNPT